MEVHTCQMRVAEIEPTVSVPVLPGINPAATATSVPIGTPYKFTVGELAQQYGAGLGQAVTAVAACVGTFNPLYAVSTPPNSSRRSRLVRKLKTDNLWVGVRGTALSRSNERYHLIFGRVTRLYAVPPLDRRAALSAYQNEHDDKLGHRFPPCDTVAAYCHPAMIRANSVTMCLGIPVASSRSPEPEKRHGFELSETRLPLPASNSVSATFGRRLAAARSGFRRTGRAFCR